MTRSSRRLDPALLLIVGAIVVFGLVVLSSASTVVAYQQYGDSTYFLKRQLLSILIGVIIFSVTVRIDYRQWRAVAFPLLVLSIALLVAVFIPGIGRELLGARRWISIGPIFFQPAELVKIMFLIYLAGWLSEREHRIQDRAYGLWPFLAILGTITLLIIRQPDIGTMTIITLIALSSYFVAGAPVRDLVLIGGFAVTAFAVLIKTASYRVERFLVFLNPQLDPQGIGYHINQALLAIGSGGLFGLGLGHSRQKFDYLPEATSDSIFAIIAEELGFIIVLGLLALFVAFIFKGYRIARQAPDEFGRILAAGITTWFGFQALINIGALTGVLPLTGIPLPFVSYGGTALITSCAAIGILANISRYARS
ncbi:MAG: putative lipid II flippase FtsW [Candidatus Kerfeldbacteria bacterium]|nr:putative lipid II flippase FtsW [Candidatus Kerfeldbacteria bacterium]